MKVGILLPRAKTVELEEEGLGGGVNWGGGGEGSCTFLIIFSAACQNLVVPSEAPSFIRFARWQR